MDDNVKIMKKILLIKSTAGYTPHIQLTPPLGLMYLASSIRARGGYDVKIMDLRLAPEKIPDIIKKISKLDPQIVGLSAFSLESDMAHKLSAAIRQMPGDRRIVIGGPYASSCPHDALADKNIDVAVIGEGEKTFPQVVQALETGSLSGLEHIRGIAFCKNGQVVLARPQEEIKDVDALPYPAWDLVDIDVYTRSERFSNVRKNRYMPIFTSRSCPYHCIYCHNIFGKGFRPRSPENVVDEMELLVKKHGIREIEIIDDIFNLDAPRAESICDLMVQRGLNIKLAFPNGLRSDLLTERLLKKMKKAGTYFMGIAVETGSARLQKVIRKNLDLAKVKKVIDITSRLKITTVGFFMIGFPGETKKELQATVDFACNSKLNFASFFIVTPFKGTELWEMCQTKMQEFAGPEFHDYHRNKFNLTDLDDSEFFSIKHRAYRRFYSKGLSRILFSGAFLDLSFSQALRLLFSRIL